MINILAIPGSLRKDSSSNLILKAISEMMPEGVSLEIFDGVGGLPHFNDAEFIAEAVVAFVQKSETPVRF